MRHSGHLPIGILILSTLTPALVNAEVNGQPHTPNAIDTLPDRDIEIRGNSGLQTVAIDTGFLPQNSITGSTEQLPPGQILAGEVRQNGVHPSPPDHNGPMVPRNQDQPITMDNVSVQLGFTPNNIQVIAAMEASGHLPAEEYINGKYLYVIYENKKVLYAGTFNDPLLEHSLARSQKEVHQRKMSEGSITIRIPASVLTVGNDATYLQVFELGSDVQQTEILSRETAQDIADRSTPFGSSIPVARIKAKLANRNQ